MCRTRVSDRQGLHTQKTNSKTQRSQKRAYHLHDFFSEVQKAQMTKGSGTRLILLVRSHDESKTCSERFTFRYQKPKKPCYKLVTDKPIKN